MSSRVLKIERFRRIPKLLDEHQPRWYRRIHHSKTIFSRHYQPRITPACFPIKVLNRAQLEKRVCECYAVVKKEYDRLLPYELPVPADKATEQLQAR